MVTYSNFHFQLIYRKSNLNNLLGNNHKIRPFFPPRSKNIKKPPNLAALYTVCKQSDTWIKLLFLGVHN